ncbi:hypothetical protein IEO_03081 [Bacillus wiedmannii]|uniref:hypothetical protein n=1 Tax=Bacillus wiedmannii TaxID=1890302 RepID=UPI00027C0171|nr:hypothetical protein [Bacillus wiedmannii]EJV61786.1 hypothetical protein IEO_03081 [Bacillus wiedmannii]
MILYNAKISGKEYHVFQSREGEHLIEIVEDFANWVSEEDIDELEIDCSECGEERWVETGTWALDKEICETCYCAYQGG